MNKADLISAVAAEAGLSKVDAKKAVEAFVSTVTKALQEGDKVSLIGFGTFSVAERSARTGILHLLFNMLWLYWFGQMFLSLFSAKHFRGLYLLGGICGGLLYMIAYNVFPYFSDSLYYSYLLGASASVLAIVVATAVRAPEYRVNFMFIGTVRLKYVALFMVVTDAWIASRKVFRFVVNRKDRR
jgi:hypothetical protein